MCGVAGILGGKAILENHLQDMATMLRHRGPDDHGVWLDKNARVGLAHTRLSILDLSSAGHQPMRSAGGRFVISFNGEILTILIYVLNLTNLDLRHFGLVIRIQKPSWLDSRRGVLKPLLTKQLECLRLLFGTSNRMR